MLRVAGKGGGAIEPLEAWAEAKHLPGGDQCCCPTFQTWKACSRVPVLGYLDGDHISAWADLKSCDSVRDPLPRLWGKLSYDRSLSF